MTIAFSSLYLFWLFCSLSSLLHLFRFPKYPRTWQRGLCLKWAPLHVAFEVVYHTVFRPSWLWWTGGRQGTTTERLEAETRRRFVCTEEEQVDDACEARGKARRERGGTKGGFLRLGRFCTLEGKLSDCVTCGTDLAFSIERFSIRRGDLSNRRENLYTLRVNSGSIVTSLLKS